MSFPLAPTEGLTHTVDGFVVWQYNNGIWEIASSSTSGIAISTNLGSFLGTLIPDNVGTLEALQVLETAAEEALNSSRGLVTISGMPANSIHLDTFAGTIITDGGTIKDALQELETAVTSVASSSLLADGSVAMTGPLDLGSFAITNVADPTSGIEVGDRDYNDGRYVNVTGDNMTGPLVLATTNGLSLTSTAHGFQNGFSTGQNIAMSNNEIVARNNGATAPLFLNRFGGDVNVGTAGATGQLNLNGEKVWSLYDTTDPDARYMRLEASGIAANALNFGTFTGAILPDNADLKAILQALETYIAAVPLSKQTVSPNEAARLLLTPSDGDVNYTQDASADPDVTSGAAMYVYGSAQWNRIAEFESLDVETNLTIGTTTATGVEIVSSTGANVTLPAVNATTAGLMPSSMIAALGIGATDANMGTWTGSTITDNVSLKVGLQELETAHDAAAAAGFKADGTTAMTGTFDGGAQLVSNIADPTLGSHVGDRDYNDNRYVELAGDTMTGQLLINVTGDASLTGTGHGLQVGPTVGNNLIMDVNEIMARSNGASGDLFINNDGGAVNIGSAATTDALRHNNNDVWSLGQVSAPDARYITHTGLTAGDTHYGTFTGAIITDNSTGKTIFQELETALEASVAANFLADGSVALTGAMDGGGQLINNIADPTTDAHVGDRLYNDGRYGSLAATGLAAQAADYGTFTGSIISDNVSAKVALQELESAIIAGNSGDFRADGSVAMAGTFDGGTQLLTNIADPTADTHVGDRLYNDTRYNSATGLAAGAANYGTFTGATISDNVTNKVALQELETAIEAGVGAFKADGSVAMTGAFDGGAQLLNNIADPTADTHVGDRLYNDTRYNTATGLTAGDTDYGTFTGDIISDNVTAKVALQELESSINTAFNTETTPTTMIVGDTWYKPSTDNLAMYVNDGNSSFWMQINGAGGGSSTEVLTQAELEAEAAGTAAKFVTQDTLSGLFELDSANNTFAFGTNAALGNTAANVTAMGANAGQSNTATDLVAIGMNAGINNTTTQNTFVGYDAGNGSTRKQVTAIGHTSALNNAGAKVTALGVNAGQNNTESGATFLGMNAGQNNTGISFTAAGFSAGRTNTGDYLTAMGDQSAVNNSGLEVVAFGSSSANANTGDNLTAIGFRASHTNTSANVTSVGWSAAELNTAADVTAIGWSSGQSNTGAQLTALGSSAGINNTGANVVAIGDGAGGANAGDQSVFVGSLSGDGASGTFNTFLGYGSGSGQSGSLNIGIGWEATKDNTGTSVIAIGRLAAQGNTGGSVTTIGSGSATNNTGDNLSALGVGAANTNTGDSVVAIGQLAAQGNTGDTVTAIGFEAGHSNTNDNVTVIGANAGHTNTGDFLTAIGYFSGDTNAGSGLSAVGHLSGQANTGADVSILGRNAGISNAFSNVSIIGASAVATADNQVMLGDTLTEQVFTHGVFRTATYDQTALPDPTLFKGGICFMENGIGGGQDNCMIYSDGVNWRKIQNGTVQ